MKKSKIIVLSVIGAGALFGAYRLGQYRSATPAMPEAAAPATPGATDKTDASGRRVLYWHDPMVPGQKFDKPGKSPFMDMQLVPVYADNAGEGGVSVPSSMQQNLGLRTAVVERATLAPQLEAVGSIAYNERDNVALQARANGYVEKLYVRAVLDPVRKGQALADIYVPDWVAAQEEFLNVKRMSAQDKSLTAGLLDGARQRMRLAGMPEAQIRLLESTGRVHARSTWTAPVSGVITELSVREGMTVTPGTPLFRINGLSTVWLYAEVAESAAAQLKPGLPVTAQVAGLADKTFNGRVSAVLPDVNAATRTIRARIELANPRGELLPGMYARVAFALAPGKPVLFVPSEAVIQTGKRTLVMLAQEQGKYSPTEIKTGREANGKTEVLEGLQAGQKVVISGQFLLDSEASLKGLAMAPASTLEIPEAMPTNKAATPNSGKPTGNPDAGLHHGNGLVEEIGKESITLSHGPISSLKWGPMTMGFKLPAQGLPKDIKVGERVDFDIRATADGDYQITRIAPASAAAPSPAASGGMSMPNKAMPK